MNNLLLRETKDRFALFPIQDNEVFDFYKKMIAVFWTADEINFEGDYKDFTEKMTENERYFVKMILSFFASADGIVNENLCFRFSNEVQLSEVRACYSVQNFIETIHSETYSLLIDSYIKDKNEKLKCYNAINEFACIKKKCNWGLKWIEDKESDFATRLVAFACIEGIFFSGSFCAIYWLKTRNLLKGLSFANELISRDEGLHTDFAVLLYTKYCEKIEQEKIYELFKECVDIEKEFICESLPCRLIGMNSILMSQYIEFVADRLLVQLGYERLYNTKNPFSFMEMIGIDGKTNFFEKRVSEYSLSNKKGRDVAFNFDTDF
jgi:ribonucleotide reductase beta subunit family protein with ferritin-like domain